MPVNLEHSAFRLLVIHGVQPGTDEELNQDQDILKLVQSSDPQAQIKVDLYRYENLNDAAQLRRRRAFNQLFGNLLTKVADPALDFALDVVINLEADATATQIRKGLKQKILNYYADGEPLILIAHSLGTVYALDVLNELAMEGHFDSDDRNQWPVQALMTLGSPLGLRLFGRSWLESVGKGKSKMRWVNIWDENDPVVSGDIFGDPMKVMLALPQFCSICEGKGWTLSDHNRGSE